MNVRITYFNFAKKSPNKFKAEKLSPPHKDFPYWTFFQGDERVFIHSDSVEGVSLKEEVTANGNKEEVKGKEDR